MELVKRLNWQLLINRTLTLNYGEETLKQIMQSRFLYDLRQKVEDGERHEMEDEDDIQEEDF